MNGKSCWKSGNKPAIPYCRTRSDAQDAGSRFSNASQRALSYIACTTSSSAQNFSCRLFCRREPFFFHRTHHGGPMNHDTVTLLDQSRHFSRIHVGILPSFYESILEQFALEFDWTFAASLCGKKRSEPLFGECLLNLIKAFPAEAKLTARFCNRISIECMSAQHLVFDLGAIAR